MLRQAPGGSFLRKHLCSWKHLCYLGTARVCELDREGGGCRAREEGRRRGRAQMQMQ